MIVEGQGASIELRSTGIVIRRRGALSALNHGLKGEKSIPFSSISAVQFKEPGLTAGYLQITLLGGVENRGGVFAAARDENTVLFEKKHLAAFRLLRTDIERMADEARTGGVARTAVSVPVGEELTRLADLRDRGVLSDEEFQAQKARLLGLPPDQPMQASAQAETSSLTLRSSIVAQPTQPSASSPVLAGPVEKKLGVGKVLGIGCLIILGLLLILTVIGASLGPKVKGDSPRIASPNTVETAKEEALEASAVAKYSEQLEREVKSLRVMKALRISDIPNKETLLIQTALIGAWGKLYQDGARFELDSKGKKLRSDFKQLVSRQQVRRFPVLRAAQAKLFDEGLWESDVDVAATGGANTGLRVTAGLFAANRNIKQMYETLAETLATLRFKRVTFEWYRGSESTYYDLQPLPDSTIAVIDDGGWASVD